MYISDDQWTQLWRNFLVTIVRIVKWTAIGAIGLFVIMLIVALFQKGL